MKPTFDGKLLRTTLLETVKKFAVTDSHDFQTKVILADVEKQLDLRNHDNLEEQQALLLYWHDLFRTGYLSWGYNLDNPDPPCFHLTERGRKWLEHFSRDPANRDGYLAYVRKQAKLKPIPESYLEEALSTYNSGCLKSAAVMVGAAAESLALELRDTLKTKLESLERPIPRDLQDWRLKRVLDAIETELTTQKHKMPRELSDGFESYWSPFAQQIRLARNEAGHPKSVDAVTADMVHASLLIFPELAKLCADLCSWVSKNYS